MADGYVNMMVKRIEAEAAAEPAAAEPPALDVERLAAAHHNVLSRHPSLDGLVLWQAVVAEYTRLGSPEDSDAVDR